ncbi:MAG: DUF2231 domain-containing protein [Vicinamibacterales bacterium]
MSMEAAKPMRSTASYKGHPIHPMLIPFPTAFIIGAFLFDAAAMWLDRQTFWTTGGYLAIAGVAAGLLAAVPGVIDYLYTVPPRSSGKARATRHALLNISAIAVVAAAWWTRPTEPAVVTLVLELAGVMLVSAGGWLGGVLVARNQIGVDHRYANAGRWKESDAVLRKDVATAVAQIGDLEANQMMLIRARNERIVLACDGEHYVAFEDRCSHRGGSLAGGVMACGTVHCPWHGSQFDVHSGMPLAGPATRRVETFKVEIEGTDVRVTYAG